MRIDEFKKTPNSLISAADRVRLESVGFDILAVLIVICDKYLNSPITSVAHINSIISNELTLSSLITKEMRFNGNLCW